MKYTQKELLEKLNELNSRLDLKKRERLALSRDITSLKKQIIYWEQMSEHQTRIDFD